MPPDPHPPHGETDLARLSRFTVPFLLLFAVVLSACRQETQRPPFEPPETQATAVPGLPPPRSLLSVEQYRQRLSAEVWRAVEDASWYRDGKPTEDGLRLLDTLASAGPLVSAQRRLDVMALFPDGLDATTHNAAFEYARLTHAMALEVIDAPWLRDGLDGYELAILSASSERVISPSALRAGLEEGFFREIYEANPSALTARYIDAVGSIDGRLLSRIEREPWYKDGLDDFEVSLIGVLAGFVHVEQAIEVLDTGSYRPLELRYSNIAAVMIGGPDNLKSRAFDLVERSIRDVEAFAGQFRSIGLILDVTRVEGDRFCHGNGGSEYDAGFIALTGPGCFNREVVVHELAHAFIGGRFPAWFSEGIAEVVTCHVLGKAAGYGGGRGKIQPDGYFFTGSSEYLNQGNLGADFLIDLYDVAGPEAMSLLVREVAGQRLSGANLLERIRAIEAAPLAEIDNLVSAYFGARPAVDTAPAAPAP